MIGGINQDLLTDLCHYISSEKSNLKCMTNQFFNWNQVQLGIDRANAPKFLKAVLILNLIVVGGTSCSNEDDCGAESSTFSDMEISEVTSSSVNVSGFVTPPPCERLNTGY